MITYRTEIQLVSGTRLLDIWKGFCKWREKSRYSAFLEKQWLYLNADILRTENILFEMKNGNSSHIERFYDENQKLLSIMYIQNEGLKIFTTTIIVNLNPELNSSMLSYTMEEEPFEVTEFKRKHFIPKPHFFLEIDSFIDHKYVPKDTKKKPLSFTPNVFVSLDIPDDCLEFLKTKYNHTANVRFYTKKQKETSSLPSEETDLEKKSVSFIVDKKNFDFVAYKVSWEFIEKKLNPAEKQKLQKVEIANENAESIRNSYKEKMSKIFSDI